MRRPPENHADKLVYMTETHIPHLLVTLAIPTIISMLISSFYNMADTFFVGRLGYSAQAAVGVALPLMSVIQAIGFTFGQGSGNHVSRLLGDNRREEASAMTSVAFFTAFLSGLVLAVVGLIFLRPLVQVLGATATSLTFTEDYARYILIGCPFMISSLVLNNQLRFQGSAFYSMIGIASGAVINIGLDPLFIFVLGMGTGGAALATIISQFVGFCLLVAGTFQGGNLRLSPRFFKPTVDYYRRIFAGGLPSFWRQALASVATALLNWFAGAYGDAAVAAMSIVSRLTMFAGSALVGFGQGYQPVCGFNYGAKRYGRVREAYWFFFKVAAVGAVVLAVLGFLFAPQLVALFQPDPTVVAIGSLAQESNSFSPFCTALEDFTILRGAAVLEKLQALEEENCALKSQSAQSSQLDQAVMDKLQALEEENARLTKEVGIRLAGEGNGPPVKNGAMKNPLRFDEFEQQGLVSFFEKK